MQDDPTLPFDAPEPLEEWRPVVGYEGYYEVSSLGRVHSLSKRAQTASAGGILRQTLMGKPGHMRLTVSFSVGGKRKNGPVHRLVAAAFLGPCPDGMEVAHGPGGPHDNRLGNLSYKTHQANIALDMRRDGTVRLGECHSTAKLTEDKVRAIRARYAAGERVADMVREYGASQVSLNKVIRRATWAHVA